LSPFEKCAYEIVLIFPAFHGEQRQFFQHRCVFDSGQRVLSGQIRD
jgi:hypothetical protein